MNSAEKKQHTTKSKEKEQGKVHRPSGKLIKSVAVLCTVMILFGGCASLDPLDYISKNPASAAQKESDTIKDFDLEGKADQTEASAAVLKNAQEEKKLPENDKSQSQKKTASTSSKNSDSQNSDSLNSENESVKKESAKSVQKSKASDAAKTGKSSTSGSSKTNDESSKSKKTSASSSSKSQSSKNKSSSDASKISESANTPLWEKEVPEAPKCQKETQWYYNNLSKDEQRIYDHLYQGVVNFESEIDLPRDAETTPERLSAILCSLTSEHPELFYVSNFYNYQYDKLTDQIYTVAPEYSMDSKEYQKKWNQIQPEIQKVIDQIASEGGSDFEKERRVHDWLVGFVDYYTDPNEKEALNTAVYRTMYGAFANHKINCVGYAMTNSYILNQLGIPSGTISGYADDGYGNMIAHEWNFVKLDGKWYMSDVCQDDPIKSDPSIVVPSTLHAYLNVSSKAMSRSHDDQLNLEARGPLPEFNDMDENYYNVNGQTVSSASEFSDLITSSLPDMLQNGKVIEVRFTNDDSAEFEAAASADAIQKVVDDACTVHDVESVQYHYYYNPDQKVLMLQISLG